MIATTYAGTACLLLPWAPDHEAGWELTVSLPTEVVAGLTGREQRHAAAGELRMGKLLYSAVLTRGELSALRDALQEHIAAPIVAPLWPFGVPVELWAAHPLKGGLNLAWMEDWSAHAFFTTSLPGGYDYAAPVLWGRFEDDPSPGLLAPETAVVEFSLAEDAPAAYALAPTGAADATGPALPDATVPVVWPFPSDWAEPPTAGGAGPVVTRKTYGQSRRTAVAAYEHNPPRRVEAATTLRDAAEIATALAWLRDRGGAADSVFVSGEVGDCHLTAAAAVDDTALTVNAGTRLGGNRYVALRHGWRQSFVHLSGAPSATSLPLTSALAEAWPAQTLVGAALLARLARPELKLAVQSHRRGIMGTARVEWVEVPPEYTLASGETRGGTLGRLAARTWLYTFTVDRGGGAASTQRATTWGRDLVSGAETFTAREIEHGSITHSLELETTEVDLDLRWWEGCPLAVFLPGSEPARVRVKIERAEATYTGGVWTAANRRTVFTGEVGRPVGEGPFYTVTARGADALFSRQVPRLLCSPGCSYTLFGAGCTLAREDWLFTAQFAAGVGGGAGGWTYTLENFSRPGGLPAGFGFEHWLAAGLLERTVGGQPQRHWIFDSAALGSGQIVVTLGAQLSPSPSVGEVVTIEPDCDGRIETCSAWHTTTNPEGKFNNLVNHGGAPFVPAKNPSFQPLKTSTATGGKK